MIMNFWDRVKNELDRQGKSLGGLWSYLDKHYGVSRFTSAKWPSAGKLPDIEVGFAISKFVDVSVDYLVTGEESAMIDDYYVSESMPYKEKNIKSICNSAVTQTIDDMGIMAVPVIRQKLSAGLGADRIDADEILRREIVSTKMARGVDIKTIYGAEVMGDSMTGIQMFDGDTVFFSHGMIRGNGLYVISLFNEIYVKRLDFDPINRTVKIISENKNYDPKVVLSTFEDFMLIGKVLGWLHCHPY